MARHKQKDDEAGGYGLGVVETRKRMWRDVDGNIVTKRPTLPNDRLIAPSYHEPESHPQESNHDNYELQHNTGPLSPPRSMINLDTNGTGGPQTTSLINMPEDQWNPDKLPQFRNDTLDMCDFLENSAWGVQPSQSPMIMSNIPYDDMFNPDTGNGGLNLNIVSCC